MKSKAENLSNWIFKSIYYYVLRCVVFELTSKSLRQVLEKIHWSNYLKP